jgi:hypothetical protein
MSIKKGHSCRQKQIGFSSFSAAGVGHADWNHASTDADRQGPLRLKLFVQLNVGIGSLETLQRRRQPGEHRFLAGAQAHWPRNEFLAEPCQRFLRSMARLAYATSRRHGFGRTACGQRSFPAAISVGSRPVESSQPLLQPVPCVHAESQRETCAKG